MNDMIDLHTHTLASGHAYSTLFEMAKSAAEKGVQVLGSSDHGPQMPGSCDAFYFINFKVIPRNLYGIHLLMGCELNILDYEGHVDLKNYYLKKIDYAIASIHETCYKKGTAAQNTAAYLGAVKNPYVTIIGHPDDSRFPCDYDTLVSAAKEHHTLLEVNSSSLHPSSPRPNARENYITMLEYCAKYQTPVIISSDAHIQCDVGNHHLAHELLSELEFPEELVINTSIDKLLPYIPSLKNNINK